MIPASAGLDRQCPGPEELKVAAIVNWYGITDVADLLDGANRRTYAVQWLGSRADRVEIAKRLSPMTYIRRDLPPTLTIHGDADPTVPYAHATALHAALQKAGAATELVDDPERGPRKLPGARPGARRRRHARLPRAPRHHTPPGGDVGGPIDARARRLRRSRRCNHGGAGTRRHTEKTASATAPRSGALTARAGETQALDRMACIFARSSSACGRLRRPRSRPCAPCVSVVALPPWPPDLRSRISVILR